MLNKQILKYEITRKLGSGEMATVSEINKLKLKITACCNTTPQLFIFVV